MIDVKDLIFTYPGTPQPVIDGISFSIGQGEVFGLLGPSGAGKSTTQKILLGMISGYQGSATLFGQEVSQMDRAIYERIGVGFELPTLYLRLTARENLELFAALYEKTCRPALEILEMVDLADAADQRVDTFSKGMKMRLNLCRALLHEPDLLFLDEPTTGQDPARARISRELILRLKQEGKTIFLTTHNMAEAEEVCDRIAFLANGKIPEMGAPTDLKRRFGDDRLDVSVSEKGGITTQSFPMTGLGANGPFLDLLATDKVVGLHTKEASLDDIFIEVTGKKDAPK